MTIAVRSNEQTPRSDGKYHINYTFIDLNKMTEVKLLPGNGPVNSKVRIYFKNELYQIHIKFDYLKTVGYNAIDNKSKLELRRYWVDISFLNLKYANLFIKNLNNIKNNYL